MKKILLASTALIASAGFAAAEVTVGGDGYFGVLYGAYDGDGIFDSSAGDTFGPGRDADGNLVRNADEPSEYSFAYDLDFDFTATGTSDSGLTYGASIDVDDAGAAQGPRNDGGSGGEIFISGDFGTLSMGDIDGGTETVIGDLAGVGLTGLGDFNETAYLIGSGAQGNGSPVARYDYTVSGLTLSLGLTDDEGYNVGVSYATDLFNVGLGYEAIDQGSAGATTNITLFGDPTDPIDATTLNVTNAPSDFAITDDPTHIIGTAGVSLSGVDLKAVYGQADLGEVDAIQYGVSAAYGFGAASVSAFYRRTETDGIDAAAGGDNEIDFYGIGGAYDLGGGLALEAGVAQADTDFDDKLTVADFGVSINF